MVAPRPASIRRAWPPASIKVLGPNRSGRGIGTPVPSSVTRKSAVMLLYLYAGAGDDLMPVRDLVADHAAKLLRRAAYRFGANLSQRFLDRSLLQRLVNCCIEPRDRFLGSAVL